MNACCQENATEPQAVQGKDDLTVSICKVCGCRHFSLSIEPGLFKMRDNERSST